VHINRIRSAFTLIEMVFVIVIIGILGTFSSDIFANIYRNYIYSLTQERLASQSEMALEVMDKYLENRIRESTIARDTSSVDNANNYVAIVDHTNEDMIEWVDSFYESKIDGADVTLPTFLPLIDVDNAATTANKLYFPVMNSTDLDTLIDALSNGDASLATAGLIFRGSNSDIFSDYAWDYVKITDQTKRIHPIKKDTADTHSLLPAVSSFSGISVYEFGDVVWTARAIKYDATAKTLTLYDDYRPWQGEKYSDAHTIVTIMENVSNFTYQVLGEVIGLHVCVEDPNIATDFGGSYALCKDKTVF